MRNEKNATIPCIAELFHKNYASDEKRRVMHICIGKILNESGAVFWRGCPPIFIANPGVTAPQRATDRLKIL